MTYPARVARPTQDSDIEELFARVSALEGSASVDVDSRKTPIIHVEQLYTGTLAPATPLTVAFDGTALIETNDGGFTIDGAAPTSPFTGDFFSLDFGGDPNSVNIAGAGVYLVSRVWQIAEGFLANGAFISPGQNLFAMLIETTFTGTRVIPLTRTAGLPVGASEIIGVTLSGPTFNSYKTMGDAAIVYSNGSTSYPQGLQISHRGIEGNATEWAAAVTIVRLGDAT